MEAAPLHHHHRRLSDERLASQLAAFGLLGRTSHVAPSPQLKKASSPASFPVRSEVPKRGYHAGLMPFAQFPPFSPIFVQGQGMKGWVFESEPGRLRFVPVRSSAGPGKRNGGTGVFLPRVAVREEVNIRNNSKGREQKRPQQPQQKPSPISRPSPNHDPTGPTFQSPSVAELVSLLPQEWSY